MSLTTISLITGFIKEGVGFFFTTKAEKRKQRIKNLQGILVIMQDEKRTRSVMGWVLTVLLLAAMIYDILVLGGDNFETLMILFASVAGS